MSKKKQEEVELVESAFNIFHRLLQEKNAEFNKYIDEFGILINSEDKGDVIELILKRFIVIKLNVAILNMLQAFSHTFSNEVESPISLEEKDGSLSRYRKMVEDMETKIYENMRKELDYIKSNSSSEGTNL